MKHTKQYKRILELTEQIENNTKDLLNRMNEQESKFGRKVIIFDNPAHSPSDNTAVTVDRVLHPGNEKSS